MNLNKIFLKHRVAFLQKNTQAVRRTGMDVDRSNKKDRQIMRSRFLPKNTYTVISFCLFLVILFNVTQYLHPKSSNIGLSNAQKKRIDAEQQQSQNTWLKSEKVKAQIIIGIGTGRCGTLATSVLLDAQPTVFMPHEFDRCKNFEWNLAQTDQGIKLAENRYRLYKSWINDSNPAVKTSGDISLWSLPYAEYFLKHDDVKILALKRNRTDTISSFEEWFGRKRHFPWTNYETLSYFISNGAKFRHNKGFDQCYPEFELGKLLEPQFQSDSKLKEQKHIRLYPSIKEGAEIYIANL